jgi:hypothetical protein
VLGEWQTALELGRWALHRFGVSAHEVQGMIQRLRVQGPVAGAGLRQAALRMRWRN